MSACLVQRHAPSFVFIRSAPLPWPSFLGWMVGWMDRQMACVLAFSCVASFSRENCPKSTNTTRGMAVCAGAPARYVIYWLAAQVFSLSRDEACMDRESKREIARQPKPPAPPPKSHPTRVGEWLAFTPLVRYGIIIAPTLWISVSNPAG